MDNKSQYFAVGAYLLAIVMANASVAYFGPASLPFNAFLFIGFDLVARDYLHDSWRVHLAPKMIALILSGSLLSYVVVPGGGQIAIASGVAFMCAGIADAFIYHIFRRRQFMLRSNASNLAGSAVDSLIFPTIAFGSLMPEIVILQFAAKVFGGFVWSLILRRTLLCEVSNNS